MTTGPLLGPLPRSTAVESCEQALRDAILKGELPAGERLPTERELAKSLGVGRVTVRSALARLESARLVSVRQGSGYRVRDFRREGGPDLIGALAGLARRRGALADIAADLLLVRRQLAHAVLEKVDRRALGPVRAALEKMSRLVENRAATAEIAAADLEVVAALLEATRSPVLQLCLNPVAALLQQLPGLREALYREPTSNVMAWSAALSLIERRQENAAQLIVEALAWTDAAAVKALR
jgi:DNA-binding FadR family transcriptional regulator